MNTHQSALDTRFAQFEPNDDDKISTAEFLQFLKESGVRQKQSEEFVKATEELVQEIIEKNDSELYNRVYARAYTVEYARTACAINQKFFLHLSPDMDAYNAQQAAKKAVLCAERPGSLYCRF